MEAVIVMLGVAAVAGMLRYVLRDVYASATWRKPQAVHWDC